MLSRNGACDEAAKTLSRESSSAVSRAASRTCQASFGCRTGPE